MRFVWAPADCNVKLGAERKSNMLRRRTLLILGGSTCAFPHPAWAADQASGAGEPLGEALAVAAGGDPDPLLSIAAMRAIAWSIAAGAESRPIYDTSLFQDLLGKAQAGVERQAHLAPAVAPFLNLKQRLQSGIPVQVVLLGPGEAKNVEVVTAQDERVAVRVRAVLESRPPGVNIETPLVRAELLENARLLETLEVNGLTARFQARQPIRRSFYELRLRNLHRVPATVYCTVVRRADR